MEKIGSYDVYRSNYYDSNVQSRKDTERTAKTEVKETQNKVNLSSAAKNLLKELKESYGNMDFIVANYSSDEEAASYLSRGTSEYSLLISPEELEKMAADKDVKEKNLKEIDSAISKLNDMKGQLGDKEKEVSRLGVSIGDDGKISYFAELEKVGEKQRERIDKQRADKKEAAAEAKKAEAKKAEEAAYGKSSAGTKRTTVYADSVKGLADKINQVDWSKIKEEQAENGYRFNFTV